MDGLANFPQINNSIDETKESENSIRINNFRKEKTINIIIENTLNVIIKIMLSFFNL